MGAWGTSWSGLWGSAAYLQGFTPNAKQDTLYYGSGASIAALATDLSQYLDNQATGATWHFEASPATRFNLTNRWCMEFDFTANNTSTGRLWTQGATGRWRVAIAVGVITLSLQVSAAIVTIGTLTLPGVGAGDERFVLNWSAEPNPDATGASNALITHVSAWNKTDGSFAKSTFTHGARDSETGAAVFWAGSTAGASPFTGTPHACRFGNRLHTTVETECDFVTARTDPAAVVNTTYEHQGIPVALAAGFHDGDEFYGPQAAWVCDATRRMYLRTTSSLYNERLANNPTWTSAGLAASPKAWLAPGASQHYIHEGWLVEAPVPDTVTHLYVRAHVRSWVTLGSATALGIRFYSMNRPGDDGESLEYYYATETVTRDDIAGIGQWDVEALVPIARSADGITYLALALDLSVSSFSRASVQAITAVPCVVDNQGALPVGFA